MFYERKRDQPRFSITQCIQLIFELEIIFILVEIILCFEGLRGSWSSFNLGQSIVVFFFQYTSN